MKGRSATLKVNKNDFAEIEEKINSYPRFLREYYFSAKNERETKVKGFYSDIPSDSIILEGACGKVSKTRLSNLNNSNIKMLVGIDLLFDSININEDLDFKAVANLENLPFKADYFNVVILPAVVEHLNEPEKVFKEAHRILKKDGVLLITTKNIYNPLMAANKFLSLKFRYWVKKYILRYPGLYLDTFPAPYRCNSSVKINRVLSKLGFTKEQFWYFGWPLFVTPSIGLFFSMIYEKLTDIKCLQFGKPDFCAKYRKV